MKTIQSILAMCVLMISSTLLAQTGGIMKGTVVDEKNNPLLFVPVAIMQDSTILYTAQTDLNGEFTVKEITPGTYNLKTSYTGYDIQLVKNIHVKPNEIRYVDIAMTPAANLLNIVVVEAIFVEPAFTPTMYSITPISIDQIESSAEGKNDIISLITSVTPGVMPTNDGKDIYIRGSRRGSTAYYVDGNRTMDVPDVPGMGISGMDVLTGGVPAMYGDCTGGLVIITTKEYKWEMNRKQNEIADRKAKTAKKKKSTN
ncbi:hypothetical protein BH10BAC1_BH10BAC1_03370 [soil metagenome]